MRVTELNSLVLPCADTSADAMQIESGTEPCIEIRQDDRISMVFLSRESATQLRDWLTAWLEAIR